VTLPLLAIVVFGSVANLISEFAVEIGKLLGKRTR
jgi:hypothetical protein